MWTGKHLRAVLKLLHDSNVTKDNHVFITFARWDVLGDYKKVLEETGYKNVTRITWEVRQDVLIS